MLTEAEPLSNVRVRTLVQDIVINGIVGHSKHVMERAAERTFSLEDVLNCLRGGFCQGSDFINDSWRYRVGTPAMTVVVAFRSETHLATITAWRN